MRSLPILAAIPALLSGPAPADPACLRDTDWGASIAPHQQRMVFELIERRGEAAVVGIRFTPLEGEFAKLFGFFLHDGHCVVQAFVVGAYASANAFRPVEKIHAADAIHYNHDYYTLTTQARLAVTTSPPSYDAARERALTLLQ